MGSLKYDEPMTVRITFRVTPAQANSLRAEARITRVRLCDLARSAFAEYFEDVDTCRYFLRELPYPTSPTIPTKRR